MRCTSISFRNSCLAFLLCWIVAGCGNSYPYYSNEGSNESRTVVIHVSKDKKITVPASTALGGGLTADVIDRMRAGEDGIIEKDGAKVTMRAKGPVFVVKQVEYNGKKVPLKNEL